MYLKYMKRAIDICLSILGLIFLSPVMIVIALLVKKNLGSPVLYKQERPGKDEKIFILYKFRSMKDARDRRGVPLPDEVRLTEFGKKLRESSLDELPELFNILKGDMSIIGPRPLLVEYLPLYSREQRLRHNVRPGLTGLAQVNGRNMADWEEKFKWDVYYAKNVSLKLDIYIFFTTIRVVMRREGIYGRNNEIVQKFKGR